MIWSSWFENHLRGKSWSRTLDPVNKTASISLLLYIRAYDSLFTFTKYGLAIHKKYYSCTISVVVYIFIFDLFSGKVHNSLQCTLIYNIRCKKLGYKTHNNDFVLQFVLVFTKYMYTRWNFPKMFLPVLACLTNTVFKTDS